MKTSKDPRHIERIKIVKQLFSESFTHQRGLHSKTKKIIKKLKEIDEEIQKAASSWPVDKLNKIDLAILRLSIYEMKNSDTPPKVIIDEAVELAKEYGGENSSSFINGVLGTIYKDKESEGDAQ